MLGFPQETLDISGTERYIRKWIIHNWSLWTTWLCSLSFPPELMVESEASFEMKVKNQVCAREARKLHLLVLSLAYRTDPNMFAY